jgi:hypothetical protein
MLAAARRGCILGNRQPEPQPLPEDPMLEWIKELLPIFLLLIAVGIVFMRLP